MALASRLEMAAGSATPERNIDRAMENDTIVIERQKHIALVAHDHKKQDLVEWARYNRTILAQHEIYATGTTGTLLERELGIAVSKLQSGPLGGDQQIGA